MDLGALFPLTHRFLGEGAPRAESAATFVRAVRDAHPLGNIPHRCARDLVQYEAARLAVERVSPTDAPLPAAPLVLSPRVRVLVYGAALPEVVAAMKARETPVPRPARGWLVLWRDEAGTQELVLRREEGWLLESFRAPSRVEDAVEDDEDRALVGWLWRHGILQSA